MTAIFVVLMVLLFAGIDLLVRRYPRHQEKPEIYYHEASYLPTPTMCDGGKLLEEKK